MKKKTEFKYYPYSVKQMLADKYGVDNTVLQMRAVKDQRYKEEDREHITAFCWKDADKEVCRLFIETEFLLDTIIEDDCIVYLSQIGSEKIATLLFMTTEDEPNFNLETTYAKTLAMIWKSKGFLCRFCNERIYLSDDKDGGFWIHRHNNHLSLYRLSEINGITILLSEAMDCWPIYYQKIVSVARNNRTQEYECLFDWDVKVTEGTDKEKTVLGEGIEYIRDYLCENAPVRIVYERLADTDNYLQGIAVGKKFLNLYVNRTNLISELNIRDLAEGYIDDQHIDIIDMLKDIPSVKTFRILDHICMHGCVFELTYGDNTIRNYYFYMYQDLTPDSEWKIDGYSFSHAQFNSAHIDENDNIVFDNGYIIPNHILYYHSYRQASVNMTGDVLYDRKGQKIISLYREPLKRRLGAFDTEQYSGMKTECFGPKEILLDIAGNRIGNISAYSIDESSFGGSAFKVGIEPTNKYGYLKNNGTWLFPPIYDDAESFSEKREKAERIVNGVKETLCLSVDGQELPVPTNESILDQEDDFICGRRRVNVEEWVGKRPYSGFYHTEDYDLYSDVVPGKWGIVDETGKMIVEPIYTYMVGFWNANDSYSAVARFVNGKLCWGLIDLDGNEVIPCQYSDLYSTAFWEGFVAYQEEEYGLYGLLTYNGEIILQPLFDYIDGYDKEHNLVSAGKDSYHLGVYSINDKKMLIPEEYDYIDFGKQIISCEIAWTAKERYFDYNGKELVFEEYDRVSVYHDDRIVVTKNGKYGIIDINGNIIIPTVLHSSFDEELYWKGYLITGSFRKLGLSNVTGKLLIPEEYSEIKVKDNFCIASNNQDGGCSLKDTLFDIEGEEILSGAYRNIRIDLENHSMTFETPYGIEHCKIIKG